MSKIFENHGDHNSAILPVEDFITLLPQMLQTAKPFKTVEADVKLDGKQKKSTRVLSLTYTSGDGNFLILCAENKEKKTMEFVSAYPYFEGELATACVSKVHEWGNGIEATVECEFEDGTRLSFFAGDYYANKERYKIGHELEFNLFALAYMAEEAPEGFSFEGQDAIDFLSKMGKEPIYDADGNVEPVHFSTKKLVAFLPKNENVPDEAEFQSPITAITPLKILDVDMWRADILLSGEYDDEQRFLEIPLYFRKSFCPNAKVHTPLRGYLWLCGRLAEEKDEIF